MIVSVYIVGTASKQRSQRSNTLDFSVSLIALPFKLNIHLLIFANRPRVQRTGPFE
jgi:hypothetical protein